MAKIGSGDAPMERRDWNAGLYPAMWTMPRTGILYEPVKGLCSDSLSKLYSKLWT